VRLCARGNNSRTARTIPSIKAAIIKLAGSVHDADLEDEKFQRPECLGPDRILKGWAKRGMPDEEIMAQGAICFDGLYAFLRRL
jgi:hypothetical protein